MKEWSTGHFYGWLQNKKDFPDLSAQLELTYHCNLNCIHCYTKGSENKERELNTKEWQEIIDELYKEGCLNLSLTGGEPSIREDFLEIYSYAKKKGFIIIIFTNGRGFTQKIINYLAKSPPFSIEITLNGITKKTYESITQVEGSFEKVMEVIKKLKKKNLPLIFKSNCLKQNKDELSRIKAFVDGFSGKSNGKFYFKYDPMICPRLNGDKTPTKYRLSFIELQELRRQDPDIWKEYERGLHADFPDLGRDKDFLYRCNSWTEHFFINPFGQLKFCEFSDKFSLDLKTASFREGFYKVFPQILNQKFKTNSKCIDCNLRTFCYHCPARAYLETGDEEAPVPYYCELAKATAGEMSKAKSTVTAQEVVS